MLLPLCTVVSISLFFASRLDETVALSSPPRISGLESASEDSFNVVKDEVSEMRNFSRRAPDKLHSNDIEDIPRRLRRILSNLSTNVHFSAEARRRLLQPRRFSYCWHQGDSEGFSWHRSIAHKASDVSIWWPNGNKTFFRCLWVDLFGSTHPWFSLICNRWFSCSARSLSSGCSCSGRHRIHHWYVNCIEKK